MALDPVCRMEVDEHDPKALQLEYEGKTYYFCMSSCLLKFRIDPEYFIIHGMPDDERRKSGLEKGGNPDS